MQKSTLKYSGENDRSLGLTGMAIAMFACDGEQYLASINIDHPAGQGIELAPEFHFAGNPRMSAKIVWNQLLKQFELATAMLMGNAICRSYVGHQRRLDPDTDKTLRAFAAEQGRDVCQLDDDEINAVYEKTLNFLDRIFSHSTVHATAREFSRRLVEHRTLSNAEIIDMLSQLSR